MIVEKPEEIEEEVVTAPVVEEKEESSTGLVTAIVVIVISLVLLLVITFVWLFLRKRRLQKTLNQLGNTKKVDWKDMKTPSPVVI